jgi:hypothetical protein
MREARRSSVRLLFVATMVAVCMAAGGTVSRAQNYWFENYEKAVELIDAGDMKEASALLDTVTDSHPNPVGCLRVPGDRCVMYCPYFQRARIQFSQGDLRGAAHNLNVSGAFGAVHQQKRSHDAFLALRQQVSSGMAQTPRGKQDVAPASKPQ